MSRGNVEEDEYVVLFVNYKQSDIAQLWIDACHCASLDSACSSALCGKSWMKYYVKLLNKNVKNKIHLINNSKVFKSGDI